MSLEAIKNYKQIKAEIFVKADESKDLIKAEILKDASGIEGVGSLHFAYCEGIETATDRITELFLEEGIQIMADVDEFKDSLKTQFGEVLDENATPEQLFETGYKLASISARQNF